VEAAMRLRALIFLILFAAAGYTACGQVLIDHYRFGGAVGNDLLTGLQGYWKFDEASGDAVDSSGNTRTLTQNGTIQTDANGAIASTRYHDRSEADDYFSIADAAWQEFDTNDFTVTLWWRPHPDDSSPELTVVQDAILVAKGDASSTGNSWLIGFDRGAYANGYAFKFYYDETGTSGAIPTELLSVEVDASFATDAWYFIYVRRGTNDFEMGYAKMTDPTITLKSTITQAVDFFDTAGPMTVGSWLNSTGVPTTSHDTEGPIDELAIWNVWKSDCQILKLFRLMPYSDFDSDPCL
jgi:hypothetical protein